MSTYENESEGKKSIVVKKFNKIVETREIDADGEIDGELVKYYFNGRMESISNYVSGVKNGVELCYFKNGNLRKESHWNKGVIEGGYYEYFNIPCDIQNTSEMNYNYFQDDCYYSKYIHYDSSGDEKFAVEYNKNRDVILSSMDGTLFVQLQDLTSTQNKKVPSGVYLIVVNPPNTRLIVQASNYFQDSLIIREHIDIQHDFNAAIYTDSLSSDDKYKIVVSASLIDIDSNLMKTDTLFFEKNKYSISKKYFVKRYDYIDLIETR